jgi:hypothetical protein
MSDLAVGASSRVRVYELFSRGDEAIITAVAQMLDCRRFCPISPKEDPTTLIVRAPAFQDPRDDAEIREFSDLLCAGLRTVAFARSGAEIVALARACAFPSIAT